MKKMESVLMVILMVFVLELAGCGTTPSPDSVSLEMVNLEPTLYLLEGKNDVRGFLNFWKELQSLYGGMGMLGGFPLTQVGEYLEEAKRFNSIFVLLPISEAIQEFRYLESKYPSLCPLSCDNLESELKSHSFPLFYFSQNIETGKMRGIIVVEKLNSGLAGLLSKGIPLDVPFRYQNKQLLILE